MGPINKKVRAMRLDVGPLFEPYEPKNAEMPSVYVSAGCSKKQLAFSFAMSLSLLFDQKIPVPELQDAAGFGKLILDFCKKLKMSDAEIGDILHASLVLSGISPMKPTVADEKKVCLDYPTQVGSILLARACFGSAPSKKKD